MSFLDWFRKRKGVESQNSAAVLSIEPNITIGTFSGDAYSSDIFRGAVDAIARNIGKLKGSHVINYADHSKTEGDCYLNRLLQVRPNKIMTAYDFLYKMATFYYLYNNAFALIERSDSGVVAGLYPITAKSIELLSDPQGKLFFKFSLSDGKTLIASYSNLLHIRRFFSSDEVLGSDNLALYPSLSLAQAQNEGAINSIKSGAHIRGILKQTGVLAPEKLKELQKKFVDDYLKMDNDGGVVAVDKSFDYTPITSNPVSINSEQTKDIQNRIYDYLGITENIVSSSYNEDQFSAFYESVIEPFATQLSQEMTSKLFTQREIAFGNAIIFEAGRLNFTSNKTKVELIKELMPLGLLSVNQALEILNLPAVENGDVRYQSLNFIDTSKALQYQLSNTKELNK